MSLRYAPSVTFFFSPIESFFFFILKSHISCFFLTWNLPCRLLRYELMWQLKLIWELDRAAQLFREDLKSIFCCLDFFFCIFSFLIWAIYWLKSFQFKLIQDCGVFHSAASDRAHVYSSLNYESPEWIRFLFTVIRLGQLVPCGRRRLPVLQVLPRKRNYLLIFLPS